MAVVIATLVTFSSPAQALTAEECAQLVDEGVQARADLQKLIAAVADDPSVGSTSDPDTASYVADLIAKSSINVFGFVSASAGSPLELCLPEGTTALTMFSDPVVLWTGPPATAAQPVTVVIPTGTECGEHDLVATGEGAEQRATFTVAGSCTEVLAETVSGALPRTGAEIGRIAALGLALVVIGFSITRRRRQPVDGSVAG